MKRNRIQRKVKNNIFLLINWRLRLNHMENNKSTRKCCKWNKKQLMKKLIEKRNWPIKRNPNNWILHKFQIILLRQVISLHLMDRFSILLLLRRLGDRYRIVKIVKVINHNLKILIFISRVMMISTII